MGEKAENRALYRDRALVKAVFCLDNNYTILCNLFNTICNAKFNLSGSMFIFVASLSFLYSRRCRERDRNEKLLKLLKLPQIKQILASFESHATNVSKYYVNCKFPLNPFCDKWH